MLEAVFQGLLLTLQPEAFFYQMLGLAIGLVFGVVPGLSGIQAMAIIIPFIFTMEPNVAFSFLLGAHVATIFAGSITAILINVPGTSLSIATCWDGHPMAQKGEGGRALGISAASSTIGGLVGVLILALAIPIMQPMILAMQPAEFFMVAMLGLTLIVTLSTKSMLKGMISGLLGLLLSFVGQDPVTGVARYTFGTLYLMDGVDLIAVVTGLYAIGEMIKLFVEGGSIAKQKVTNDWRGVWQGVMDTLRHWWLTVRCSVIGALVGACPGVGGTVANVVAYGHAVQTSKDPDSFGTGRPEGLIAPETSNNAKEGPQMIPTLALGIPGGESSAILLGAFLILGLQPGPAMLTEHLDITFTIIWIIALSSILASVVGLLLARQLATITAVPGKVLVPIVISLGVVGAFASSGHITDVFVAIGFGVLGYLMRKFGYSEACLIIGLVLGTIVERNFQLATMIYGLSFFYTRPISLILLIVIVLFLFLPIIRNRKSAKSGKGVAA